MKQYNELIQLEVNRLSGRYEVELVKRQAELLPQTFAAFCGSSGRSVKIWVRYALPNPLTMPEEEAVRQTINHYHRQTDEQTVRLILHNLYREFKGFGKKSSRTKE